MLGVEVGTTTFKQAVDRLAAAMSVSKPLQPFRTAAPLHRGSESMSDREQIARDREFIAKEVMYQQAIPPLDIELFKDMDAWVVHFRESVKDLWKRPLLRAQTMASIEKAKIQDAGSIERTAEDPEFAAMLESIRRNILGPAEDRALSVLEVAIAAAAVAIALGQAAGRASYRVYKDLTGTEGEPSKDGGQATDGGRSTTTVWDPPGPFFPFPEPTFPPRPRPWPPWLRASDTRAGGGYELDFTFAALDVQNEIELMKRLYWRPDYRCAAELHAPVLLRELASDPEASQVMDDLASRCGSFDEQPDGRVAPAAAGAVAAAIMLVAVCFVIGFVDGCTDAKQADKSKKEGKKSGADGG